MWEPARVVCTGMAAQAFSKMPRMSAERLVKEYLGYRQFVPVFMKRHPSEWISPRTSSPGCAEARSSCQGMSSIFRRCFLPGPCWGKRHGHDFEYEYMSQQFVGLSVRPTLLCGITTRMAFAHSSRMPGYAVSRVIRRR